MKHVPFEFIEKVFITIEKTPQHTYQILTKRPKRALEFYQWWLKKNDKTILPSNIWLGVTIENQNNMGRAYELFRIPAAVSYWSVEPMLSEITFGHFIPDWIIIGCESGPKRRECKLEWVRDLVEQCKAAGVRIFVKQLSINNKVEHDISKFPKDLQIRQMPKEK